MTEPSTPCPPVRISDHQALFAMLRLVLPSDAGLSPCTDWRSVNGTQHELLRSYCSSAYPRYGGDLAVIASTDSTDVNALLEAYGYGLAGIDPGSAGWHLGGVRRLEAQWPDIARPTRMKAADGTDRAAVLLPADSFTMLYAPGFGKALIRIPLADGRLLWVTGETWTPDMGDLGNLAFELVSGSLYPYFSDTNPYGSLVLPALQYKLNDEIGWLAGLHTATGGLPEAVISHAEYRFELELGTGNTAAPPLAAAPADSYVMDGSIMLFTTHSRRRASLLPEFAAYIAGPTGP